jgi:hypothetical protein
MAQTSPPERIALANALLDAMDFDQTSDRIAAMKLRSADSAAQAGYTGLQAFAKKYFTPENLRPATARTYAELFTDEELGELIQFYRSPVAKKLTELQPTLGERNQAIVAQIIQDNMGEYLRMMSQPSA